MSRAFVKEPDGLEAFEDLPEKLISEHRNMVTAEGLAQIEAEVESARTAVNAPTTFASAVGQVSLALNNRARARAVVLHLLWRRLLASDLTRTLDNDSEVIPV